MEATLGRRLGLVCVSGNFTGAEGSSRMPRPDIKAPKDPGVCIGKQKMNGSKNFCLNSLCNIIMAQRYCARMQT